MKKDTLITIIGGVAIVIAVIIGGNLIMNHNSKKSEVPPIINIPGVTSKVDNSTNNAQYKEAQTKLKNFKPGVDSIYIEVKDENGKVIIPKELAFKGTQKQFKNAPIIKIPKGYILVNEIVSSSSGGIVEGAPGYSTEINLQNAVMYGNLFNAEFISFIAKKTT
ncbi:hypothetical protein [uncultured Clostridium sp.]|jgi:hypothetical protein|uniref:hypothetical protein n=1 Tax=uncultured Clostridium sp. TaxID=59620 RepID=UPI00260D4012|nr:hypothetical protein [uncultured Clostridium sp.]